VKIGIYNRHLATLGGGERYMLKIAEILSRHTDIDVISQRPVPPGEVWDRLGIDVSEARIVEVADDTLETVAAVSEKYDLFINASHFDPVPSRAPASILLVHFPIPTPLGWQGRLRRAVAARVVRPMFSVPILGPGFGSEERSDGTRFWWTNGEGEFVVPGVGRRAPRLLVPMASFRHDGTGPVVRFVSGDEEVGVVQVAPGSDFAAFPVTPTAHRGDGWHLSIHSDTFIPPPEYNDLRALGVAVGEIHAAGGRGRTYRLLFQKYGRALSAGLHAPPLERPPTFVSSYSAVWSVSRFVQHWTRRYWGVGSSLIHPPVDVEGIMGEGRVPKENLILNVGRFFDGNHNKKHLEMISAFRRLLRQGLSGWQLVLVGGVSKEPTHQRYLQRVREAAEGLPVRIVLDLSYRELVDLYARASIYWHATGYGEDERREPAVMEHFGITTVEAMAAGCVPVVIERAGQREIVRHGRDGLLWRDLDELVAHTWSVILAPSERARLAEAARDRSLDFSHRAFERRLLELVNAVVPL
jgi:glycosyltransferase involved in cell wall biosynthesis